MPAGSLSSETSCCTIVLPRSMERKNDARSAASIADSRRLRPNVVVKAADSTAASDCGRNVIDPAAATCDCNPDRNVAAWRGLLRFVRDVDPAAFGVRAEDAVGDN